LLQIEQVTLPRYHGLDENDSATLVNLRFIMILVI
jgi:hypothetical protein